MFARRYFAGRYFAPRYWPPIPGTTPEPTPTPAPLRVVLLIDLGFKQEVLVHMAENNQIDLQLIQDTMEELVLSWNPNINLNLAVPSDVVVTLENDNQVEVRMST